MLLLGAAAKFAAGGNDLLLFSAPREPRRQRRAGPALPASTHRRRHGPEQPRALPAQTLRAAQLTRSTDQ
jgi:hypothetical protein